MCNFSPLPFYPSIAEQNAKRWWVGKNFPLFADSRKGVPFQFLRTAKTERVPSTDPIEPLRRLENKTFNSYGGMTDAPGCVILVYNASVFLNFTQYAWNLPDNVYFNQSFSLCVWYEEESTDPEEVMMTKNRSEWALGDLTDGFFTGETFGTYGTDTYVAILAKVPESSKEMQLFESEPQWKDIPTGFQVAELVDANTGSVVEDVKTNFGMYVRFKTTNGVDVICWDAAYNLFASERIGQFYLHLNDGDDYYSDVFTCVNADVLANAGYVELSWRFISDLVMDAGVIAATATYRGISQYDPFIFRVWLPGEVAKPEYVYEEEGETRDGYFYPAKQITKKRYHFAFLASEFLLDALRFVRLADFCNVKYRGWEKSVTEITMSPEWESNGDVASVDVDFDTDAVAKVIGTGYVSN